MSRPTHPSKEVEQTLRYAEAQGWRITVGGGHCWGRIYCPLNDRECRCGEFCITSVWSTPRLVRKVAERRSGKAKTGEEAEFTGCK
ncbi:hypothetical protein [Pseudomonas sp. UFMG81]|uniref:hypothetical protein n=1 Tax=Pseudomonas sp. UFMG81 TaxID=2745936 RepID=UPI003A5C10E9